MHITVVKADVVCLVEDGKSTFCEVSYVWQMLLPGGRWNTTRVEAGRCHSQVADGIATVLCYFSSGVLNRTSSHICGRWYLPTFLLRDGSLALMYIASFNGSLNVLVLIPHFAEIF